MGGIDLCDSLSSLYKYPIKSHRWYLYIFYHLCQVTLVNSWLIYRRDYDHLHGQTNNKTLSLKEFSASVAAGLIKVNSSSCVGRPSMLETLTKRRRTDIPRPAPDSDSRYDLYDHFPVQTEKRLRCALCPRGNSFSFISCSKCEKHLCLNKDRNCFYTYHHK